MTASSRSTSPGRCRRSTTVDEVAGRDAYRVSVAAVHAGALSLAGGLRVLVEKLPRRRADMLIVPGGPGVYVARGDAAQVAAIRTAARPALCICSVCTGAFLLAEAGLLDAPQGRHALAILRAAGGGVSEHSRAGRPDLVRDGRIWTSAGVTAGIDLTLALIEDDLGPPVALQVARRLVVYMRRPGGQVRSTPRRWRCSRPTRLVR